MLADDHNVGRQVFSAYITDNKDNMRVVGEAANGKELLDLVAKREPDIVLLDLEMPVMDGFQTLKVLSKEYPHIKTIIFSTHYNEFYISELILNGARGYVSKTAYAGEVFKTIQKVYEDGFYFNKGVSDHILQTLIEQKQVQQLILNQELTSREIEVLHEVCNEKQNKEIAKSLNISEDTVEFHKKNIYRKTNTHSVVGLVKYALKAGITSIV